MSNDRNGTEMIKGRGAQINTTNRFLKHKLVTEHIEGLDEELQLNKTTQYLNEFPKKIINVYNIDRQLFFR